MYFLFIKKVLNESGGEVFKTNILNNELWIFRKLYFKAICTVCIKTYSFKSNSNFIIKASDLLFV